MTIYEKFMEFLNKDFGELVQDDDINGYLASIGGEVVEETDLEDRKQDFIVVSGYEKERGKWGTAYDKWVRFGSKIYDAKGVLRPMLLTPKLFWATNQKGEEIEYRFGIFKDAKAMGVIPVLLRKDANSMVMHIAHSVVDERVYCVDQNLTREVGRAKAFEITLNDRFLKLMWQVDDYLRRLNQEFRSDYGIEAWSDVELFFSRYNDIFIGYIIILGLNYLIRSFGEDSILLLSEFKKGYQEMLIRRLENALIQQNPNTDYIKSIIKDLFLYIENEENYDSLDRILDEKINIIPYISNNLFWGDSFFSRRMKEIYAKIIERTPEFINQAFIDEIWILFFEQTQEKRSKGLELYKQIWDKRRDLLEIRPEFLPDFVEKGMIEAIQKSPARISQKLLDKILELGKHTNSAFRFQLLKAYKVAIEVAPQYINVAGITKVLERFSDPIDDNSWLAKEIYKYIVEKSRKIPDTIPSILDMIHNGSNQIKELALFAYAVVIEHLPQYVSQGAINEVFNLISEEDKDLAWIALNVYKIAIQYTPLHITQNRHDKIMTVIADPSWIWRRAGLQVFGFLMENRSDLINNEDLQKISSMVNDANKYVKATATKLCQLIPKNFPEFTKENIIDQILQNFTDQDPQIKKYALESYETAIKNTPQLISQEKFETILALFASEDKDTKQIALNAFETTLKNKPELITQENINELFSHISAFGRDITKIQEIVAEKTPQFVPSAFAKNLELLSAADKWVRNNSLEIYAQFIKKFPELVNKENLVLVLNQLCDKDTYLQGEVHKTLKLVVESAPIFIPQILDHTINLLASATEDTRKSLIYQYQSLVEKDSKLIPQSMPRILELLESTEKTARSTAFGVLKVICETVPIVIDQQQVDKFIEFFSDPDDKVKINALELYRTVIQKLPDLVNQEAVLKLPPLFSSWVAKDESIPYIRSFVGGRTLRFSFGDVAHAARLTYLTVLECIPQLIPKTLPILFAINLSPVDSIEIKIMMLRMYKFALENDAIDSITENAPFNTIAPLQILIACFSGSPSQGWGYDRKKEDELIEKTLEAFQLTMHFFPGWINNYLIQVLMNLTRSSDFDVQDAIRRAIQLLFEKRPELIPEIIVAQVIANFEIKDRGTNSPSFKLFEQVRKKFIEIIAQKGEDPVIKFLNVPNMNLRYLSTKMYFAILEKDPNVITHKVSDAIIALFDDKDEMVKWAALKFFNLLVTQRPDLAAPYQARFVSVRKSFPIHQGLLDLEHDFLELETLQGQIKQKIAQESQRQLDAFIKALEQNPLKVMEEISDSTEDRFKYLAIDTFKKALEKNPKLISEKALNNLIEIYLPMSNIPIGLELFNIFQNNPHLITPTLIQKLFRFFSDNNPHARVEAMDTYGTIIILNRKAVTQEGINKLIEQTSDKETYFRRHALDTLGSAIRAVPQFIKAKGVDSIIQGLSDSNTEIVISSLAIYSELITKLPQFIDIKGIKKVSTLISSLHNEITIKALKTYENVIWKLPEFVFKEVINQIISIFTQTYAGRFLWTFPESREQALKTYKIVIAKLPLLVTQEGIEALLRCFTEEDTKINAMVKKSALEAYIEAFGHTPQYISDEGFEEMQKALSSNTIMKDLWRNLGSNYSYRGEYSQAIESYERGLKFSPDNADLLNGLAWTYYLIGEYDKCVPLAKKAVGIAPSAAHIWDTLACGYYGLKDYQRAWESFHEMKKINKNYKGTEEVYLKVKEEIEKEGVKNE